MKRERCKKGITQTRLRKKGPSVEIFQWLTDEQSREIADVMISLARLADKPGVDIEKAVMEKIEANEKKYPVELSKGNAAEYNMR